MSSRSSGDWGSEEFEGLRKGKKGLLGACRGQVGIWWLALWAEIAKEHVAHGNAIIITALVADAGARDSTWARRAAGRTS